MSVSEIPARPSYGVALHALSMLTGQPEHFFLGRPDGSSRARGANLEFVAMLLLDLDDTDALTARRRTAPRPQLLAVVDELEHAENVTAGPGLADDDEFAGGWAA
ncbi:hypothetical protein ACFUTY_37345 [Streptomyces sp. NPDC057362]|uniref:hypothetical protein n=1 Tax=Streptomyces sp. NPDC057362 TaxID=3346106 RepID=UPI003645C4F5